jgi:galactokinase
MSPPSSREVASEGTLAGGSGHVTSTLPIGAGLSSSASLDVALALAIGFDGPPEALATLAQRAEHKAAGVRTGLLDQLAICLAEEGHALLLDCGRLIATPVPMPPEVEVLVVHSGAQRSLEASAYEERRLQCEEAASLIGPLPDATATDTELIGDAVLRHRARHVVTENARALAFAEAFRASDVRAAGLLMDESHASLRDDFEVSSPELETAVSFLRSRRGVLGARLTGAGFGGCAVALVEPGAVDLAIVPYRSWRVRAAGPARRLS